MDPHQVKRLHGAWLVALACVTGATLLMYGSYAAVLTALAFVGASVLSSVAFVLWLLLGDASVASRVLLIALFFGGLLLELRGLVAVLELFR